MTTFKSLPHNQPTRLRNVRCAYCNAEFTGDEPEKEHVIGKNFVPKGSHQQWWNLHLNSCHKCNQKKSRLENDISAITMQQPFASQSDLDVNLASEAKRKSVTISQRTGKPVKDSTEEIKIKQNLGKNVTLSFGFSSPPQVDPNRMFQLACFQLVGFFYLLTYCNEAKLGKCWVGVYAPIAAVPRSDWGNANITSFSNATSAWDMKIGGAPTSNGYYQFLIKKNGQNLLWSWAIEWNKQYRLYGFFGDKTLIQQVNGTLEKNILSSPIKNDDEVYHHRFEIPLQEDKDQFFVSSLESN